MLRAAPAVLLRRRQAWVGTVCVLLACSSSGEMADATGAGQGAGASAGAGAGAAVGTGGHGGALVAGASGEAGAATAGASGEASEATAGVAGAAGGAGAMADASLDASTDIDASVNNDGGTGPSACATCAGYASPLRSGALEPAELEALSGLAMSRRQPRLLFAHNDHARPVVYALDLQGRLHARISLQSADSNDIEDIAVGPCGADTCVFLADTGDNSAVRGQYGILRFVEPELPEGPDAADMAVPFERFEFTYEDGSHNAEGLMVAPDGTLYIVTKLAAGSGGPVAARGASHVYRLSLSQGSVAIAQDVATLPIPASDDLAASAAAAHPCGLGFLVRTYNRVYEFRVSQAAGFEAAFAVTPEVVAMPDEPQSEGIDYVEGGSGFLTSGEGVGAPIMRTDCD